MNALHGPSTIFSGRNVPSWLLLACAAGAVNGGALIRFERYVTHVTGTATRMGLEVGSPSLLVDFAIVLGFFLLGAMSSVLALGARRARGKEPLWALPLVLVSALLAAVAWGGQLGFFGPFGGMLEQRGEFVMLAVLAFAMGLQNAAVATTTGLAIRTTHMTGPASDLAVHLATAWFVEGEQRRAALRGAALRGGKLVAFIVGGAVMLPLTSSVAYLAFVLPAGLVLGAAALSFVPAWNPRPIAYPDVAVN